MLFAIHRFAAITMAVVLIAGASLSDGGAGQPSLPERDDGRPHSTPLAPSSARDRLGSAPCVAPAHAQHNYTTSAVCVAQAHAQPPPPLPGRLGPARCVAVGHARLPLFNLIPRWCPHPAARREPLRPLPYHTSSATPGIPNPAPSPLVRPSRALSATPQVPQPQAASTPSGDRDGVYGLLKRWLDIVIVLLIVTRLFTLSPRLGLLLLLASYVPCVSAQPNAVILTVDTTQLAHLDTDKAAQVGRLILSRLPAVFILTRSQQLAGSLSALFTRLHDLYTVVTTRESDEDEEGGIVIGVALDVPLLSITRNLGGSDSDEVAVSARVPLDAYGQEVCDIVIGGACATQTVPVTRQLPQQTRYLLSTLLDQRSASRKLCQSVSGLDVEAVHERIVLDGPDVLAAAPTSSADSELAESVRAGSSASHESSLFSDTSAADQFEQDPKYGPSDVNRLTYTVIPSLRDKLNRRFAQLPELQLPVDRKRLTSWYRQHLQCFERVCKEAFSDPPITDFQKPFDPPRPIRSHLHAMKVFDQAGCHDPGDQAGSYRA